MKMPLAKVGQAGTQSPCINLIGVADHIYFEGNTPLNNATINNQY
jgi:hypothetical protein